MWSLSSWAATMFLPSAVVGAFHIPETSGDSHRSQAVIDFYGILFKLRDRS